MSTLYVDRILPLHGSTVAIESASLSYPDAGDSVVPSLLFAQIVMGMGLHAYAVAPFSIPFSDFTMTGVIQRVGNVATLAWEFVPYFTCGSATYSSGIVFEAQPIPMLPPTGQTPSGYASIIEGSIQDIYSTGRISINSLGQVTIYSDENVGAFVPETQYRILSGSISWLVLL